MKFLDRFWQFLTSYLCRELRKHTDKIIEIKVKRSNQMGIICTECGHDNELDALYCDECGSQLPKPAIAKDPDSNPEPANENNNLDISEEQEILAKQEEKETEEKEPEEKEPEKVFSLPLSELEKTEPSIPVAAATRLELPDDDEPALKTAPTPTMLQLSRAVLIDNKSETSFELPPTKNTIYIGRANEELPVQVDLSDLEESDIISRVHAAIHSEGETFFLEDAGSSNGTWLNGEKLRAGVRFRKKLQSGDVVAFGKNQSIELTFEQE